MSDTTNPTIRISDVINMIGTGYTRTPKNAGYNSEIGSIQEHYGLDEKNTKELFRHPKLSGLKTRVPFVPVFSLIDDVAEETTAEAVEETTTENAEPVLENN